MKGVGERTATTTWEQACVVQSRARDSCESSQRTRQPHEASRGDCPRQTRDQSTSLLSAHSRSSTPALLRAATTLAHTTRESPPRLTLSRINRLLRPLRSALAHLATQLDTDRQRACSGYGRDGERDRYRPYQGQGGRAESDDSEDEWSARSKKRRRQSSASIAGRASKRSSVHQLDAADPSPSSSPFRAVRPAWKKHYRTAGGAKKYGSKRGRGTDSATPEDDADHRPTRRVRGPGLGTGEERAGVEEWTAHLREYARPNSSSASISSSSAPPLSSESIHRTTAVLRAYTNILDSIVDSSSSPSSAFHLSSLAESSARDVGWAIEENVRGWLVENGMVSPEPSSDSSSEHGSSGSDDSDGESPGPTSVGMDRAEGVSAQEAEMQASRLVDEWYEACPTYTWRCVLLPLHPAPTHLLTTSSLAGSSPNTRPRFS